MMSAFRVCKQSLGERFTSHRATCQKQGTQLSPARPILQGFTHPSQILHCACYMERYMELGKPIKHATPDLLRRAYHC